MKQKFTVASWFNEHIIIKLNHHQKVSFSQFH